MLVQINSNKMLPAKLTKKNCLKIWKTLIASNTFPNLSMATKYEQKELLNIPIKMSTSIPFKTAD